MVDHYKIGRDETGLVDSVVIEVKCCLFTIQLRGWSLSRAILAGHVMIGSVLQGTGDLRLFTLEVI